MLLVGFVWAVVAGATAAVVAVLWLPQRLQFARLCEQLGPPRIVTRGIDRRDGFTRYRKAGDRIEQEEIGQLTATHVLASAHEPRPGGVSIHRQTIRERSHGGGGGAQCPNPVTAAGSAAFQAGDHLARDTVGRRP